MAAGWYPDPSDPSGAALRRYDGRAWTADVAPVGARDPWAPPGSVLTASPPQSCRRSPTATTRRLLFVLSLTPAVVGLAVLITSCRAGVAPPRWLVASAVAAVVVANLGTAAWERRQRDRLVELARQRGDLDGASWWGLATRLLSFGATLRSAPFPPLWGPGTGLVVVRPGEVRFLPGERALRDGHRPWQLATADLDAQVARVGPRVHAWLHGRGGPVELQLTGRAQRLRGALSRSGAAVR